MLAEFLLNRVARQAEEPPVGFRPQRCLRCRLNSYICDRCLTLCKQGALSLSGRKIVFTAERCTGCMACVAGCPNDALVSGFDLLSLPRSVEETGRGSGPVVLSCGRTRRFTGQITIPCLGLLSEPVLAALDALASRELYLDATRCAACNNHHVLDLLEERMQGVVRRTWPASGHRIRYVTAETVETDPGRQRRSLLRLVGSSIRDLGREASSSGPEVRIEEAAGASEKGSTLISRLLQQALARLAEEAVREREVLFSYLYTLEADRNCDRCPSCTGMCPTGALKRRAEGSTKQLLFTSAGCSGCGLCVAFCRKKALTLRQGATSTPAALLAIA